MMLLLGTKMLLEMSMPSTGGCSVVKLSGLVPAVITAVCGGQASVSHELQTLVVCCNCGTNASH
jgi:hypothetical protein